MMKTMMMLATNLLGSYMGRRPSAWATTACLVQWWKGTLQLHSHLREGEDSNAGDAAVHDDDNIDTNACHDSPQISNVQSLL